MIRQLMHPWYASRPSQIFRRMAFSLSPPTPGYRPIRTSWGVTIRADTTKTIGFSLATTGVYDLTVSETLARLISPGDTVIDAGANIGYMTVLASVLSGPGGRVISFEPHPELFGIASDNAEATSREFRAASIDLRNVALGDALGDAELVIPSEFGANDGIAHIAAEEESGGRRIKVPVETIDGALGEAGAAVMKVDVEGFELQVFRGAEKALKSRRIRHIVFEEHQLETSRPVAFLQELGYHVYSLGWSSRGLEAAPAANGKLSAEYEPCNLLATVDPDGALGRIRPRGWRVLRRGLATKLA